LTSQFHHLFSVLHFLLLSFLTDLNGIEIPLLDTSIRLQIIFWKCFIYLLGHFHITMKIACFNQKEEEVQLWPLNIFCFQVGNYFENLEKPKVFLSFVLHPQSTTPNINPWNVNISPNCSTYLRNIDLMSLKHRFLCSYARISSITSLIYFSQDS
jgi:hypothetical protein